MGTQDAVVSFGDTGDIVLDGASLPKAFTCLLLAVAAWANDGKELGAACLTSNFGACVVG